MKLSTLIVSFVLFCSTVTAQQKFVKEIIDPAYGNSIRVLPASGLGWVVFSLDNLRLTKFNSCGESEWSKKYNVANDLYGTNDFIKTQDGGYAILTSIVNGNSHGSLITKLDSLGAIVWSKSYEDASYNQVIYTLSEDQQGNLVFFANMTHIASLAVYNMICKINNSGTLLWTKFYDHGGTWGGAIVTSDNGILVRTGNIFIKTDNSGNVQWTTLAFTSAYYYLAPVEVSDGYIFSGYNSPGQVITFCKLDKLGKLLWGGRKTTNFSGNPPSFRIKSNGNFVGTFYPRTIVEFDKDLNVITQSSFNTGSQYAKDICFLANGTPVIAGSGNVYPFFSRVDQLYHTQCDIATTAMNFISQSATASYINTVATPFNPNTITRNYTADSIFVSVTTLCSVPKLLDLGKDTVLCNGITMILKNRNNDTFDHYQWSTGETTAAITIDHAGTYWLLVNDDCRENRLNDTVWVHVLPALVADLGTDLLLCENTSHLFIATACDTCTFTWSNGSHTDEMEVSEQGTYWLSVMNNKGCTSTDTVEVSIGKCECDFFIPNAFTPNGDGLNDLFNPVYHCDMEDYNMKVFNRWGQLVFTTDNNTEGWNGDFNNSAAQSGIYIYIFNYRPLIKGKLNQRITRSGTVSVMY